MPKTARYVVVYQPSRLHVGITDGRTRELEAAFFQRLAHGIRLSSPGGQLLQGAPRVMPGAAIDELPHEAIEGSLVLL